MKLQSRSLLFQVPVVQGTLLFKDNHQQGVLGAIMGKKHMMHMMEVEMK